MFVCLDKIEDLMLLIFEEEMKEIEWINIENVVLKVENLIFVYDEKLLEILNGFDFIL